MTEWSFFIYASLIPRRCDGINMELHKARFLRIRRSGSLDLGGVLLLYYAIKNQ